MPQEGKLIAWSITKKWQNLGENLEFLTPRAVFFHSFLVMLSLSLEQRKEVLTHTEWREMEVLWTKAIGIPDFPGGAVVKNPPANARDTGLSPGPGRSHMPRSN